MNERIGKIALLGGAVLALAASASPLPHAQPRKRPAAALDVKKTLEWQGAFCAQSAPGRALAQTPSEWAGLWKKIGHPPPPADMGKFTAVAVFLGTRATGGYGVSFEPPRKKGKATVIQFREMRPARGGFVIEALTHPYHVRLFPKISGPVLIEEAAPKAKTKKAKETKRSR